MRAPATVQDFLTLGYKSGLLEPATFSAYRQSLPPAQVTSARELADALVRDGLLTRFQAESLLAGKWRGFLISGKYRLLHKLGSGGMGSVYLCEHVRMRRRVALKILPIGQADDPAAVERFTLEARAVAALDHPNIVRAHDVDVDNNHGKPLHFIVLEYVDGNNLHDLVRKHGALSPLRAAHYIRQAAQGLANAHEAGLVHRDIKPGNLLLDRNGVVKLLDMGLARFFHEKMDPLLLNQEVGNTLGTAEYVAPEQVDDSLVDIRADIYSLGTSFYFLLTGNSPFPQAKTMQEKLTFQQVRKPKPVRSLKPEIPEELARIVDKMMAKEIGERYQTPAEVVEALAPWTQATIGPPSEEEMPPRMAAERGAAGGSSPSRPSSSKAGPATPKEVIGPFTPSGEDSPRASLSPVPSSSGIPLLVPPANAPAAKPRAPTTARPGRGPGAAAAAPARPKPAAADPKKTAAQPTVKVEVKPAKPAAADSEADDDQFATRILWVGAGIFTAGVFVLLCWMLFGS